MEGAEIESPVNVALPKWLTNQFYPICQSKHKVQSRALPDITSGLEVQRIF